MELAEYLKRLEAEKAGAVDEFAAKCETSVAYLKQIASGRRRAGDGLAIRIDKASGGAVPCEVTRPDIDWAYLRSTKQSAA